MYFGFGRSGAKLLGLVSFHGIFDAPPGLPELKINTPILLLHGWNDPLAKPEDVIQITEELTRKEAIWELNAYGHVGHAFTNPKASSPEDGMLYNAKADRNAWNRMLAFFDDALSSF
ncbi:dienelactone hydrolase family protein [Portibacter marinus]|uniref:dienelactone hydrolase family protein n=1 Tax=Portibacter marinus TaxID=2898660 RepID=UPI001F15E0FD|nr:dienelactone hydrolase family protein [Portibacter marinus]